MDERQTLFPRGRADTDNRALRSTIISNRASPFLARDKDNVGVLLTPPRTLILHDHSESLRRHSVVNAACVSLHSQVFDSNLPTDSIQSGRGSADRMT